MVDVFLSYRRESGSEFASFLKLELSRLGYKDNSREFGV